MNAHLLIFLLVTVLAEQPQPKPETGTATHEPVTILYPHPNGAILAFPHVSIIFKTHAPRAEQLIKSVKMEVDGREVPENAIDHCTICAGPNPAVIAARAPWTIHDGWHHVVITETDPQGNIYRSELNYVMDSSIPSLSGLTGGILFPNSDIAYAGGLRLGVFTPGLTDRRSGGWQGISTSQGIPLEIVGDAVFRHKREDSVFSWKLGTHLPSPSLNLSIGERQGDFFAVLGYRTQPNYFNVSLGVGASDLPSAWAGMSYSLTHLTPHIKHSKKLDNFFAVVDLVSLHAETDSKGKVNLGATLSHPYGWRAGLYRVRSGLPDAKWQLQVSYSLPLK